MTQTITFDPARLHDAAAQLGDTVSRIADALDELDARAAVLSGSWSGEAQQAYADAHRAWSASMRRLTDIAGSARSALDGAGDAYADAERVNAARWPL